jgi:NDP-sugar pyrophosphorylase family protein/tRNA A-37 threonylcarbamoyl transferase component Bud32
MKAMILAAGLGTRLLPLTENQPKPLFPILDRPLIDILIQWLQNAGCEAIVINTHHLGHMIEQFVNEQAYGIPVVTRHESTILGTGGGIKNVEDFWDDEPFIVVNGDIFANIDPRDVYQFHLNHRPAATLVLHDYPQFNHVWVDPDDHIRGFGHSRPCPFSPPENLMTPPNSKQDTGAAFRKLAFTGIHILDPQALRFIPKGTFSSIIHAYCEMIQTGLTVEGFVAQGHYWHDIGSIEGYREATRDAMGRKALGEVFSNAPLDTPVWSRLQGDGSDRTWYRVTHKKDSLIVVDHGPPAASDVCEADSFARIGQHLHDRGIPVPRIFAYHRPSGLIALEDLGDLNVQSLVQRTIDPDAVLDHYKKIIDLLITFSLEGAKGFEAGFSYQTPRYDRELILERESRYFVEAFLNDYRGLTVDFQALESEFEILAKKSLGHPYTGLLHRDFQSRNILVKNGKYYFIDFQGARFGPLPYDLASLLIDPYVQLSQTLQEKLLKYAMQSLADRMHVDEAEFIHAYNYSAINRNLQILGAFAFLTNVKGKKDFEDYIPPALASLKQNLLKAEGDSCTQLRRVVEGL